MADEWWKDAPLADAQDDGSWWKSAPLADAQAVTAQPDSYRPGIDGPIPPPRADAPMSPPAQPQSSVLEQTAIGTREGVASILGLPVDAVAGAINGIPRTINAAAGTQMQDWVTNPVGGSESINRAMDAVLPERVAPQGAGQRFARRIGQEVGAAAIPMAGSMGKAASAAQMAGIAVPQITSAVGSGIGAQTAREIAPDSALAEIAGQVIGGVAGGVAGGALRRPKTTAPSVDDLKAQASDLYAQGDMRPGADAQSVANFRQGLDGVMRRENLLTPTGRNLADGNVRKFIDVIDDYTGQPMTPRDMQSVRKFLTDAAGSADPADRRIGKIMLDEFDKWRNAAVPEYAAADKIYGRLQRAKDVDFRVEKAENRAASTGTGGNTVNAARQNIRQILDNPKAQRGYSPQEIDMMRAIVRGDTATNALRLVGRLSPTSGALPLMGNIVGVGVNPIAGASIMGGAAAAKGMAELRTLGQINALAEAIRSGAVPVQNSLASQMGPVLNSLAVRSAATAAQR